MDSGLVQRGKCGTNLGLSGVLPTFRRDWGGPRMPPTRKKPRRTSRNQTNERTKSERKERNPNEPRPREFRTSQPQSCDSARLRHATLPERRRECGNGLRAVLVCCHAVWCAASDGLPKPRKTNKQTKKPCEGKKNI